MLDSDTAPTVRAMSQALDVLGAWMSSNRLRLNPSKTQCIWLSTGQQLAKIDLAALASEFLQFGFYHCSRYWHRITFARHNNKLCRDCYYQLRPLRVVCRSLTTNVTTTLIYFIAVTRLDYADYAGHPAGRLGCFGAGPAHDCALHWSYPEVRPCHR